MRHVIMTRMGIGIARPSFYAQHIAILAEGLFKSMIGQTCQDFEWYICVDKHINPGAKAQLASMLAPYEHFAMLEFDPVSKGRLRPRFSDIKTKSSDEAAFIALSRIDDDDAINRNFVEMIRDFSQEKTKQEQAFSIGLANGIELAVNDSEYRKSHDTAIALGLTAVSREKDVIDIYRGNHRDIEKRMAEINARHYVIESDSPQWIYAIRPGSESFLKKNPKHQFQANDSTVAKALQDCNLSIDWDLRIKEILKTTPDESPSIPGALKRMKIKTILLAEAKKFKNEGDAEKHEALVGALYAV